MKKYIMIAFTSILMAKDLVKQIKVENKPPYLQNKNIIVGTPPKSQVVITLPAVDSENQGIYTIITAKKGYIGDGIVCKVRNGIQIVCDVPNINLNKYDICKVNTINNNTIESCKEYRIPFYLKDDGYMNLPPAISENYYITLRVSKEYNETSIKQDMRREANYFKNNFSVASYTTDTIKNILPTNLQKQYKLSSLKKDKNQLFNNKLDSQAINIMKNASVGKDNNYILNLADTITTGVSVSSAPIYCTITRNNIKEKSAYVCSLDPLLTTSSDIATKYFYNSDNLISQNYALNQCQEACQEQVQCNDESSNEFYTFIRNKNYITENANQAYNNNPFKVSKLVIEKRDNNGNFVKSFEYQLNTTLKEFYFDNQSDSLKSVRNIDNIQLICSFRDKSDIKTYVKANSFYIEPQKTCYIKVNGNEYPEVNSNYLYSFKLLYFKPNFVCPLDNSITSYSNRKTCENNCKMQGDCLSISEITINNDKGITNNCKDVVLTNGEKLSSATAEEKCKLIDEVSLDSRGNVKDYFVRNRVIVNPLREDLGFSEDIKLLKKENAIEMVGSYLDMLKNASSNRLSKLVLPKKLIGFDGKEKDKNFDYLATIYKIKDSNASVAIVPKISPDLYDEIKDGKYKDSDYSILPIVLLVNKINYGEKDKLLKTFYLLDLDDYDFKIGVNKKRIQGGKYNVILGKIGDNYWRGHCTIKHLQTSIWISDPNLIKSFKLKRLKFDDYIMVKINGKVVHVGPYGGNTLYLKNGRIIFNENPIRSGRCELNTNWDQYFNIEAKQFLKKGSNKIDIYVEVSGWGEGYAFFEADLIDSKVMKCGNEVSYCNFQKVGNASYLKVNVHTPRIINELNFLKKEGVIYNNSSFNLKNLFFKLSDGSWGITKENEKLHKDFLNKSKLNYEILYPDKFLNTYKNNDDNIVHILLPTGKSVVGVTDDEMMQTAYNDYKKDKKKYLKQSTSFNKYSIPLRNTLKVKNFNVSTVYSKNMNDYIFGQVSGLIPVHEDMGEGIYNSNTLRISDLEYKWDINLKKIDFDKYVKNFNLWDRLYEGDTLLPFWLAFIDFNTFQEGKLFLIVKKQDDMKKFIDNVKQKGIQYLINYLENDYNNNKNYYAWNMNERYKNSLIYNGNGTYKGLDSVNVNRYLSYFGLYSYNTLCPKDFYFRDFLCKHKDLDIYAAALPLYFTNQLANKAPMPMYASFDKETLVIREMPEFGINIKDTNIICPQSYKYNSSLKECVKYTSLDKCNAPNGSYDFEHQACIASPACSEGGIFSPSKGKCVKLTPNNYTGENGYYFVFEKVNDTTKKFYTPIGNPTKFQCVFSKYKCSIDNKIFNSKELCDSSCFRYEGDKKVYGNCNFINIDKKDKYNDYEICKSKCYEMEEGFNSASTLIINGGDYNKYSNISIYKNGKLVANSSSIKDYRFYFGENGILKIGVNSGDEIKIVFNSTFKNLNYVNGIAYWDDKIGNKVTDIGNGIKCFNLNKYNFSQNYIGISLDIDNDGIGDINAKINNFYCISNNHFSKIVDIKVTNDNLNIKYYDDKLNEKIINREIIFKNEGECKKVEENTNQLEPIFIQYIGDEYNKNISNVLIKVLGHSYYNIKDNPIDKNLVENFKNHFCYYPLQEEYQIAKSKSFNDLKNIFYLYRYYNSCPDYLRDYTTKLLKLDKENAKVYKLGIQTVNKKIDLDDYDPVYIYNVINREHFVTLPLEKGIYLNDNLYIKIPHLGRRDNIYIGYGYSPFKDCKSITGTKIKTDIEYTEKVSCDYQGNWKYDSKIKKCIANPSEFGCIKGTLQNGKCVLDPKCPSGYIAIVNGKCKKIILHEYKENKKICKPWWTLRRKYICDIDNNLIDGYIFGLPKWITIKSNPVYYYKDFKMEENK